MDAATQYAQDVVNGKIIAGKKMILACQRHLTDLEKSKKADYPFCYSKDWVKHIVKFVSLMPDVNTGETLKPAPFQIFILSQLFGWRTKDGDHVRFNKALISMARTNSKTALLTYVCVYALLYAQPKMNKQIIILARAMKQAGISFKYAKSILNKMRVESNYLYKKIDVLSTEIRDINENFIKPYASDSSTLDGLHPSIAVVDEYHELKDRSLIDVIQSGMIQNPDAQLIMISTAGFHANYPMYKDYELFSSMLDGAVDLDRVLFLCWEQDSESEISRPETWEKSNPLMCVPEKKKILTSKIMQERDIALKQGAINGVMVKNFNLWRSQEAANSYLSISDWNETLKTDFDITGRPVYVGVDLSKSNDSTALAFIFPYTSEEDSPCWHVDSHSFIATRGGIEARENADGLPYRELETKGQCSISALSSGIIDIDFVYEWLANYIEENNLNVISLCYDSWNFNSLLAKVDKYQEWVMVPLRQGTYSLNTPTREFRERLLNKQITHSDNEILKANFMNAITVEDNNGIKIDKSRNSFKIDAADATIDAFSQAMYHFDSDHTDDDGLPNWTDDRWNDFFKSDRFSF